MTSAVMNGASVLPLEATNGMLPLPTEPEGKQLVQLFVKSSNIDVRRAGSCLFCQEFWMELHALFELGVLVLNVRPVFVSSEAFKKQFSAAQPPILVVPSKDLTITEVGELEQFIFHAARDAGVCLFEKDDIVDKKIQSLYRNFKVLLKARTDKEVPPGQNQGSPVTGHLPLNKMEEQLEELDKLLEQRQTRYLVSMSMTQYDCELMPRLHHIRIAGEQLGGFEIPHRLLHLWNYMLTAYRTAAFIESCPFDQDILHHYKEQLNLPRSHRDSLQQPSKTLSISDSVLKEIQALALDRKFD